MIERKKNYYEKAILVGLITPIQDYKKSKEYINELEFLAKTAQAKVYAKFIQKLSYPNPKTFVGSGKLQEILHYINNYSIDTIIFDDELSPDQLKNIKKLLNQKVIDRTQLILDIFAQRAKTFYAKTQVELAQYQYLLPRLTRMWTHLERQKGGIGLRGPGETEIETDRRIVRNRINLLHKKLLSIDKQMSIQRKNRDKLIRVSLVGYTNVGKSTLMNILSKSNILTENKLFATVDTTVRKVTIKNIPFLLTDTVGFIRKLPISLIESFKSTLDEVRESDILLHVVDISHKNYESHIHSVNDTFIEIKVFNKIIIMIFNKIDQYYYKDKPNNKLILNNNLEKNSKHSIFVSANTGYGIKNLKKLLYQEVKNLHIQRFPYNNFSYAIYDSKKYNLK